MFLSHTPSPTYLFTNICCSSFRNQCKTIQRAPWVWTWLLLFSPFCSAGSPRRRAELCVEPGSLSRTLYDNGRAGTHSRKKKKVPSLRNFEASREHVQETTTNAQGQCTEGPMGSTPWCRDTKGAFITRLPPSCSQYSLPEEGVYIESFL